MLNRGVNGDTATDMLARFEHGVIAEHPDLVLWQVGTNSLLRGDPVQPHRSLLHGGIVRLKATGADVVLIDPQYAPRVIARPNVEAMVALLEQTARFETVNLFHRFALMRHWHEVERMPFEAFLSPDELHMNDFSYGCIARALGERDRRGRDPPGRVGCRAAAEALNALRPPSAPCIRSSTRSSGCSSPQESRTIPSVMPSSARAAGVSR